MKKIFRPYEYQLKGIDFLINKKQCLLCDEMGLGKTMQALFASEKLNAEKILIICPNSVKHFWSREIKEWLEQKSLVIQGNKQQRTNQLLSVPKWTIINYESARLHPELIKLKYDVLIIDEAHKIKNRKTKTAKFVKKIKADRKFLLTGTPILNRPDELWSLLNLVDRKNFRSYWRFANEYCLIFPLRLGSRVVYKIYGNRNLDKLKKVLENYMIRRKKKEVMSDLPDKIYNTYEVGLLPYQKKLYNQMKQLFLAELESKETLYAPSVLSQLTRLRQISISSGLINEVDKGSKLDEIASLLMNYPAKTVVYSNFIKSLTLLKTRVKKLECKLFIGSTPLEERQKIQNDFNCGKLGLVLATIQTGGLGVNFSGGGKGYICR